MNDISNDNKVDLADKGVVTQRKCPRTGVYEISTGGRLLDFNPGFAELLGSGAEDLADRSLLEFIHPEDRADYRDILCRLAAGDLQGFDDIARLCNPAGDVIWCRSIKHLVGSNTKREAHIIGLLQELGGPREPDQAAGSHQQHMAAFATATMEGLVLTQNGRIIDCNPQFAHMVAARIPDLIGLHIEDFVPADLRAELQEHIRRGYCPPTEFDVIARDGRQIRVEAQAQQAVPGPPGAAITNVRDITEHWRREQELKRLNRTHRAARDSNLALINAQDETSYMHQVCRILVEDCGHPLVWIGTLDPDAPERLHVASRYGSGGEFASDVPLYWLDAAEGISPVHRAIRDGQTVNCPDIRVEGGVAAEHRDRAAQKGYASMVVIPLRMDTGTAGVITILDAGSDAFSREEVELLETLATDLVFGLQVLRDRDARVRAQEALGQRTRELEALLNTIPAAVYVRDMEMRYRTVNPFFCREFGLSAEQVLGRRNEDVLPAEIAITCAASDRRAIETGEVIHTQECLHLDDGGTLWWSTAKTLIYDDNDHPVGLVSISTDITGQKQNEEARLAQMARQRDQLIREVHHRIKNHLQGVVGLLRGRVAETGEATELFEEAVRQVLSIAQVYGLQSRGSDIRVELHELIAAICRSAPDVEWAQPEVVTPVYIDEREAVPIALILNELLTNAVKHSPASGDGSPRVRLAVAVKGQGAEVKVVNRPAELPPAFDFSARTGLGTGLELVCSLLPSPGALLQYSQVRDEVTACLVLTAPVISFTSAADA